MTLNAVASPGYSFVGWGGACQGSGGQCTVTMTRLRQAYASFRSNTAGKPGPLNTGVPAGVTLSPSGSLTLTTAGEVVDGLDINGCVDVRAKNVVIRRSRIRCDSYYPVRVHDTASLLIEDVEIVGTDPDATSGIAFDNYVARRVNVHGSSDGLKVGDNVTIEDSWIHDLWLAPGDHADGIQSTGSRNIVIRNNLVDITDHGLGHGGEPNSAIQTGTEWSSNSNWLIDGNWLLGGGWTIHFDAGNGVNNMVRNNRFGRGPTLIPGEYFPFFGPISWLGQGTFLNNVWDDTGEPLD